LNQAHNTVGAKQALEATPEMLCIILDF